MKNNYYFFLRSYKYLLRILLILCEYIIERSIEIGKIFEFMNFK